MATVSPGKASFMNWLRVAVKPATTLLAPWLSAIAPFWPLIWRLALAAAIFGAGWHYGGRSAEDDLERFKVAQAQATSAAVSQMAADIADRDKKLANQERESAKAIADLQLEQAARPPRVVRVCPDSRAGAVSGLSGAAGVDAADERGEAGLRSGTGSDIGPGLSALAKRANVVLAKCLNQEARQDELAAAKPGAVSVK